MRQWLQGCGIGGEGKTVPGHQRSKVFLHTSCGSFLQPHVMACLRSERGRWVDGHAVELEPPREVVGDI